MHGGRRCSFIQHWTELCDVLFMSTCHRGYRSNIVASHCVRRIVTFHHESGQVSPELECFGPVLDNAIVSTPRKHVNVGTIAMNNIKHEPLPRTKPFSFKTRALLCPARRFDTITPPLPISSQIPLTNHSIHTQIFHQISVHPKSHHEAHALRSRGSIRARPSNRSGYRPAVYPHFGTDSRSPPTEERRRCYG